MYPPDTYPKDIYSPDTYPLDTYPLDTYPLDTYLLGQILPGTDTPWTDTPWANKTSTDLWNWKKEIAIYFVVIDLFEITPIPLFLSWPCDNYEENTNTKQGFIVNIMANNEYYRFCQPSFLYSYLKLAKKNTNQNWLRHGHNSPPPWLSKAWVDVGINPSWQSKYQSAVLHLHHR